MTDWIPCSEQLPPIGEVVMTKIDDGKGCRNESTELCEMTQSGMRTAIFYGCRAGGRTWAKVEDKP
jgi:hypothetical protein